MLTDGQFSSNGQGGWFFVFVSFSPTFSLFKIGIYGLNYHVHLSDSVNKPLNAEAYFGI